MFSLKDQKCKLTNVNVRAEKHGDENKIAADLKFNIKVSNDILSEFDPLLKSALYKKGDDVQGELIKDDGYLPALKFPGMGAISWGVEFSGYTLVMNHGIGGKSNIKMLECGVDKFRFTPQDGGTVEVDFRVICHPLAAELGRICEHIQDEVEITLIEPAPIDD